MGLLRINVIVPKKPLFDFQAFSGAIKNMLRTKTEPDLRRIFRETTSGWKEQPEFTAHHFQGPSSIGVQVYTRNGVYGLVNSGSPAHLIRPRRRGGLLKFQPGYNSATRPGSLHSRAYRRFGQVVTASQVRHPGFEARKFDEQIVDTYTSVFAEDVERAIERGIP